MDTYESEQEQIETIKQWWKENGISVLTGIALGLALLFGWRGWQSYVRQQEELASNMYTSILNALEKGPVESARKKADELLSQQSNSTYAALAALNLARQDLKEGRVDASLARLQWVIDQSQFPQITQIARLRQSHLYLSQNQLDKAQDALKAVNSTVFKGAHAELQGDIALARGKVEDARKAYTQALESQDLSIDHRNLVQMKLDDIGTSQNPPIAARIPTLPEVATPSTAQNQTLTITPTSTATVTPAPESKGESSKSTVYPTSKNVFVDDSLPPPSAQTTQPALATPTTVH